MNEQIQRKKNRQKVYNENPYDLETFFESMSIASDNEKELLFVDRLISLLRSNPDQDLADLSFQTLRDLKLIDIK
jgi:hypothetical protein